MPSQCSYCGRFISHIDFFAGKADIKMLTPDSEFTRETWEIICPKCNEKNHENAKTNIQ